ncbi:MAG: hypothetical protein H7240_08065 [Glaciimonas sp.]|nr:hypothetical protein [Glaciimonas sp.]
MTQGTSLGLAIVKHVLSPHKGHLMVTSEPGKGSCFNAIFERSQLILDEES